MISFSLKYDISGMKRAAERFQNNPMLLSRFRMIANNAIELVKLNTPGSGKMRGMWRKTEKMGKHGFVNEIVIDNTYKPQDVVTYMEEGTRPHKILPKVIGGRVVFPEPEVLNPVFPNDYIFAKEVDHPGTVAYRMVGKTQDTINLQLNQWIRMFETDTKNYVDRGA